MSCERGLNAFPFDLQIMLVFSVFMYFANFFLLSGETLYGCTQTSLMFPSVEMFEIQVMLLREHHKFYFDKRIILMTDTGYKCSERAISRILHHVSM
jgi:hypothetical protein